MHPAEIRKKRDKTPDEALAALMRLCARAEKSEGDARRLMRGWGVAEKDAEQVLGRLVRDRFIDDSRYAEAFVREKLRLSGWGEYKIRTALQRKGVSKERIDAALSQADRPAMGERLAQQLERMGHLAERPLPATSVRGGFESLHADGGDEVLDADHLLAELLVDQRAVGEREERAVGMRLA